LEQKNGERSSIGKEKQVESPSNLHKKQGAKELPESNSLNSIISKKERERMIRKLEEDLEENTEMLLRLLEEEDRMATS